MAFLSKYYINFILNNYFFLYLLSFLYGDIFYIMDSVSDNQPKSSRERILISFLIFYMTKRDNRCSNYAVFVLSSSKEGCSVFGGLFLGTTID